MYSLMTVPQLKEELKKRNAALSGKKASLIERLEAYDRNNNFGAEEVNEDELFVAPAAESFRDINANTSLPPLTKLSIQAFVDRFQTKYKGRQMYESRFLLTARVSKDHDKTFIQGQCKAQMKKMLYLVNIQLNNDGTVEQSNCECAAGSGTEAHCKHVMVLLHGIEDMVRTKTIILHQVCTQKLMAFKIPRKVFHDSPLQAPRLPNKRKRDVNYLPLKEDDIMDNYQDYVRNLAVSLGSTRMAILQTIRPANTYAVENDHAYTLKSSKDRVLEELLLKNVSVQKIKDVEIRTRHQNACKEWHKQRSFRITASNYHAVLHSKQITRENLARKILNPKPFQSKATMHGKIQEPVAISKYCEVYDLNVLPCGLIISQSHPFLAASPDGLLGEDAVIEVKCPYVARNCDINPITVPYLEEKNGDLCLKTTSPYYCQIQGQLFCANKKFCNLIIYTFVDMKVIFVDRNEKFINEMLKDLTNFYENYLKKAILDTQLYKNYDKLKPIKPLTCFNA